MDLFAQRLPMFVEPVSLTVMLVYCFGFVSRTDQNQVVRRTVMGVIFGLAAVYSMVHPVEFAGGHNFDLRNLFIGVAMAFFGWIAGLIALSIGIVVQLLIGGGNGLAILAMTLTAIMGLIWRSSFDASQKQKAVVLFLLGGMLSADILLVFFLPIDVQQQLWAGFVPLIATMDLLGAFFLGRLLQREEAVIKHAHDLEHAASTDPLTNLPNRRTLVDKVAELPIHYQRPNGRAVIYLDIDHFKTVNDTFGHLTGDAVLTEVVRRIRNCLRPDDLFARIGGDEFAVVLPDINESNARRAAERFCQSVAAAPLLVDGSEIDVTVSMGVFWTDEPISFDGLLMSADAQLYHSKAKGRNRVSFKTGVALPPPANVDVRDMQARRSVAAL